MPDDRFLTGANLPWLNYGGDFGANAWRPQGGVACVPERVAVERALAEIAATGATLVRWFIFCDGRAGLEFDPDGRRVSLDHRVFADMDAALELLSAARLQVIPVLFDFSWCRAATHVAGVQAGGRRRWLVDDTCRATLIDAVLEPFMRRYGRHPAIWAWDLINEPEWVTFGLGTWEPFFSLSEAAMRRSLRDLIATVRPWTARPITVGLASARGLSLVGDLGLDLYQVHWYDHLEHRAPLGTKVADFALNHPTILGEFPTRGSARTPEAILTSAARCGYAGALAWSALATDRATNRDALTRSMTSFLRRRDATGETAVS